MTYRLLSLTVLLLAFGSAQAVDRNLIPFELDEKSSSRYSVLQCPASDEALKDFRTKLLKLKNAIKKEANCDGISQSVEGLADLVTKDRENFLALISKGQVEGLTTQEQSSIENYVTNLTVKTSNLISVLTGNDGCFDEDKKGQSTEFIASLIGEGSKILSVIGGPQIGGLASIASGVITGFSNAAKVIRENTQGYDFSIDDQKLAYADSLCALFDYRRELDNLMYPYDTTTRLNELIGALNQQLSKLNQNCVECADIIRRVDKQTALATNNGLIELTSIDQIWPTAFEKEISLLALSIDELYINKVGTHTYQALKTRSWLPIRARTVESSALTADLGLENVLSEIDNIERFMVDDEAGSFMKQLVTDVKEWRSKINSLMFAEGEYLAMDLRFYVEEQPLFTSTLMDRYGAILEALENGAQRSKDSRAKARVRSFMANFRLLSQGMNVAVDVANRYCTFFENSNWYRSGVVRQCPNANLVNLADEALMFTNYRLMMPSYSDLPRPKQSVETVEVTADWVEALSRSVEDMTKQPNYVKRQTPPPL